MRYLLIIILLIPFIGKAQTTAIPDANFEQALINQGLDTGAVNGFVPTTFIDTVTYLYVANNNISNMSGIEDFTSVRTLLIGGNLFSTINLSQNDSLIYFNMEYGSATALDLSNKPLLKIVEVRQNQIATFNFQGSNNIKEINAYWNWFPTSIDVSNIDSLEILNLAANQLVELDVSQNSKLKNLVVGSNSQLTCLNVNNGNNSNITTFECTNNPNLSCIEVSDTSYANVFWNNIDPHHFFNLNCNNGCSTVGIEEENEISINTFPNPTTGNFTVDLGEIVTDIKAILTNSLGQVVFTKNYTSTNLIELEIEGSAGIYFLQLETANTSQVIKILKE